MNFESFLSTLVLSATATSVLVSVVKEILDKTNRKYNSVIVASICSFVIGFAEIFIFYSLKGLAIEFSTFVYGFYMAIANVVVSQVGYDKVKKLILALCGNKGE